jgi:NAD(P)-dependent dehydrogenase (short-subunit alcohol dehydrogenase family)
VSENSLRLDGRTIVVAGAGGGGIGTAICAAIAEANGRVLAVDNDADRLAVAAALGDAVTPCLADVRDPAAVEAALAGAGTLYGLVHVAGGLGLDQWERTEQLSLETFDEVLALNLRAAFVTSQAVAARLIAQGEGGAIVHLASIAALSAMPFGAAYAVAKAGLLALMRTQAVEWGPRGIRVNAIAAGSVRTPKNAGYAGSDDAAGDAQVPLRRRGEPDDIAGAALFLVSDLAGFVTGHTLVVDGGASVRPSFLDDDDLPVFVRDTALRARLKP